MSIRLFFVSDDSSVQFPAINWVNVAQIQTITWIFCYQWLVKLLTSLRFEFFPRFTMYNGRLMGWCMVQLCFISMAHHNGLIILLVILFCNWLVRFYRLQSVCMFMGELCLLGVCLLCKTACVRRISCEYYGLIVFFFFYGYMYSGGGWG